MSQNPNSENSTFTKPINDELVDIFQNLAKDSNEHITNPVFERVSFIGAEIEAARDLEISRATQNDR